MKAVVLAGGFAKRMWPLTKDKPKHLLPVAGKPMLDYIVEKLELVPELDKIFVSTNAKFEAHFRRYTAEKKTPKDISLSVEDTRSEEEKLGSVGALGYVIRKNNLDDELLVIGGDNIFEFEMTDFVDRFRSRGTNIVALYDVKSKVTAQLYGVVCVDSRDKIVDFQEKPAKPQSTLVSTACYGFTRKGVRNILRYLNEGNDSDKMGHLIEWLCKNDDVCGFVFEGVWFDIGSFESYEEANKYFSKKLGATS